jgi:phage-related protein
MPNFFKKLASGAKNFFQKLPSEANSVIRKVNNGIDQGLGFVNNIAGKVGNTLEKSAPLIAGVAGAVTGNPVLGLGVADALSNAQGITKQIQNSSSALKGGTIQQKLQAGANQFGVSAQGTGAQNSMQASLANAINRSQGGMTQVTNQLAQMHQSIANAS